ASDSRPRYSLRPCSRCDADDGASSVRAVWTGSESVRRCAASDRGRADDLPAFHAGSKSRMSSDAAELSIVIPAYNEEQRLGRALSRIREYFASKPAGMAGIEIVVVDDGSTDGTARVAQDWTRQIPSLRLLSNGGNRGKGYSVRQGMLGARGRIALFTDADLSAPIEESEKLLAAIHAGNDAAIGS